MAEVDQDEAVRSRLLLVEDDPLQRRAVARALGRAGYDVVEATDLAEAVAAATTGVFDVALLDFGLPDGHTGLDVLRALKARDGALECVLFTGDASAGLAVEAYDAGAVEYFEKPISDWPRFFRVLERASRLARLTRERVERTGDDPELLRRFLVGGSRPMEVLRRQVARLAPRATTVLLLGPTGSGKTRVAQALHAVSGRRGGFEVLNVAGVSESLFNTELFGYRKGAFTGADSDHPGALARCAGGTLVLDEIGDLRLDLQTKLLQVLEERVYYPVGGTSEPVRCRVIAATNQDLDELVRQGRFRADLANRLGIRIEVPGLHERREDIPQIVYTFLREVNEREGLDLRRVPPEVLERLGAADWSGENLRGLRTAVERMAIFSDGDALEVELAPNPRTQVSTVAGEVDGLPASWRELAYNDFKEAVLGEFVGRYVRSLLDDTGGNVSAAARRAGMHGPNFRRLMRRFDVRSPDGA